MEFALLGPVEVHGPSGPVELGGPRGQSVLAALLLNANRVVSLDALVDAVWGEQAPASARTQVQNRVSALRKALNAGADLIVTEGSGYSIRIEDGRFDLGRFGRAVLDADLLAPTEPLRAAETLAAGLAIWRGPALDGLPTPYLRAAAQHLEERRMIALGKRIQLDLDLGRHADLVPELTRLTSLHQFREDFCGQLMLALYRTGRQAAALDAFRSMRLVLDEQLGVAPGAELRQLHEAILRADDRLLWTVEGPVEVPGRAVPRSLPADITDFTGRSGELAALDGALGGQPIVAITGTAGVGKTALAVHWAHRVANRFPDGQLYLDLRGYAARSPLRPVDALGSLLRALGTRPDEVPLDDAEAAALFRSRLADLRMLLVLDNAGSVDQVRPLLPGSPGSLVLVTSRERLGGLVARHGAHRVSLDVLSPDEARALLARLIGEDRMLVEPAAATELAGVCAYLPLALRIAAAHLADRPHRGIAEYVAGLRDDNRLSALAIDGDEDAAVRITLDLSYQTIPVAAQRMFRLLGLVPGVDFTPDAAAALAAVPVPEAAALLNRLAGAHLVSERSAHRYAFHDLLRQYARERADAEDAGEGTAAVGRLVGWYLAMVSTARDLLYGHLVHLPPPPTLVPVPEFTSNEAALGWLDSEHRNLVAAIEHVAVHGPRPTAWLLADGLRGYVSQRSPKADWFIVCQAALASARAEQDPSGQAAMHASLAQANHWLGRNHAAIEHLRTARALALSGGWPIAEAHITSNLGIVLQEIGLAEQAEESFIEALALCRRNGPTVGEAVASNNLGNLYRRGGRLHAAAACVTHSLAVYHRIGGVAGGAAAALDSLARVYHDLGQLDRALTFAKEAVDQHRRLGNSESESVALLAVADVLTDRADYHLALEYAEAGLRMSDKPGKPRARVMALITLAAVLDRLGLRAEARARYEQALAAAIENETHYSLAIALNGLAKLDPTAPTAMDRAMEALTIAEGGGFRVIAGRAMATLAELLLIRRLPARATDYARWALHRANEIGHPLDQARAHAVLLRCG